ncbi:MAG: signal peptide peptidase SppA [Bacteroidetes bacterium]|nr:signal peptide peptidase SppA [Bacteroidota bacterium]MBM3424345.1 signal peptide peptidase SppA [Bacteroidota bacterium]
MSESSKVPFNRVFWPALVAIVIALFLGMLFFLLVLGGIIGSFKDFGPEPYSVQTGSVLKMKLEGNIQEKSSSEFDPTSLSIEGSIGLPDILFAIDKAKTDRRVKGIYLDIDNLNCGISTMCSIREALENFQKESKKFVTAYFQGESISQKEYYLGSVAKECYAFPTSSFYLTGLGSEQVFFKNLFDKLDVEVDIVRGENNDFKSAVEPFFLSKLSDSAKLQNIRLLETMWEEMLTDMVNSRKVSADSMNLWINEMEVVNASQALKKNLVDALLYKDEVMQKIADKVSESNPKDIEWADFNEYAKNKFYESQLLIQNQAPSIAVIIAEGEVSVDGDGLSSDKMGKLFAKVRADKDIKAVVFRINSPGGSALASEEIWREVSLTQQQKKVFVSMGDVAASGGYYIATPAERIFAEPTTITGSIGVFGMIPYTGKMLENKLGITFDRVQTHEHAIMSMNRKLTRKELAKVQDEINDIYLRFLQRVSEGRKLTIEEVNVLARGRVWSGVDALDIGLVDELGTLTQVIDYAKKSLDSEGADVIYYPLVREDKLGTWLKLLQEQYEENESVRVRRSKLPENLLEYYQQLKSLERRLGFQMRMPYDLTIR